MSKYICKYCLYKITIVNTIGTIDDLIENYQNKNEKLLYFGRRLYLKKIHNECKDLAVSSLDIKYGISLTSSKRAIGNIPLLASNGISDYINASNAENAIVFGCRGTIGNVFYQQGKCFVLNTALYINNNKQYGNLYFALDYEKGLTIYQSGAAQPQITIEAIKDAKLKVPNDDELNNILDLYAKNYEIINKLKYIKEKLLDKYF